MWNLRCLNYDWTRSTCKVLKVSGCDQKCKSAITDPEEYIDRLMQMLEKSKGNPNTVTQLRREIAFIAKEHNINLERDDDDPKYVGWNHIYRESIKRRPGGGGGASEGSAGEASLKAKMKDNRPVECKQTKEQREEIKALTEKFEEEHGKLERLSKMPLSRNKVDSYTGEPIK